MAAPPCYDRVAKKDCPRRAVGCAQTCPEWAEYLKLREAEYAYRKDLAITYEITNRQRTNAYTRLMKKRKGKKYGDM